MNCLYDLLYMFDYVYVLWIVCSCCHFVCFIEEEDLVRPDEALLLALRVQPRRPLVGDEVEAELVPNQ